MHGKASYSWQTPREEVANYITHGLGLAASVAGTAVLIVLTAMYAGAWQIMGSAIYGGTLMLLYGASTLYHAVGRPRAKRLLRVVDHCAIYVLIAGSYTPFLLILRGEWGWTLLWVIWGLCVAGIVFKAFFTGRFHNFSTAVYVLMGWLCVIAAGPLLDTFSGDEFAWLLAGGLAYTAGTAFYLHPRLPYAHAIWHLFVIAGSFCHYLAVWDLVL